MSEEAVTAGKQEEELHCLQSQEGDEIEKLNEETCEEDGGRDDVSNKKVQFYFVKFWPYKDPEYNSKFERTGKLFEELEQEKLLIDEKMVEIMFHKEYLHSELEGRRLISAVLECALEWRTMVIDFLQAALNKSLANEGELLTVIPPPQSNSFFSSSYMRRELNSAFFWYSRSKNRAKFEQLIEDITQIEERKEKAMVDAASEGNIWYPITCKEDIEEQIRLIDTIPEELRPERSEVMDEIAYLEEKFKAVEKDENALIEKFQGLLQIKEDALESVINLSDERKEAEENYFEYLSLLSSARELAGMKDVAALEELSRKQVDKFMCRWNDSQPFRISYEKAILPSLDVRQLSRDGRIRNDDEEPNILKGGHMDPTLIKSLVVRDVAISLALLKIVEVKRNQMQGPDGHH